MKLTQEWSVLLLSDEQPVARSLLSIVPQV